MKKNMYEKLAMFRGTLRKFLRFSEEAAVGVGLQPKQHQALLAVKGFSGGLPITIGDLALQLQVRHHSAVGIVDRLEREGYLKRRPFKDDRRKVSLHLTKKGDAVMEKLSNAHYREIRILGPKLIAILQSLDAE